MSTIGIPIHNFTVDDATSISFKIIPLEKRSSYDTSIPHRHNYYEIFIFTKGGGIHDIDFQTFNIESRSVHYVSPGQVHQVKRELDSYGYVILFSRDFYYLNAQNTNILSELPFLNNNNPRPILELNENDYASFISTVDKLHEEYHSNNPMKEEILRSYLNILLIESKRNFKDEEPHSDSGNTQLLQQFRTALENNFTKLHKVSEYATSLAVSEKHLNDALKKSMGKTASEMIQGRIILEAKRLFMHSDLSNKEIAYFLSFDDPSHFSKFFKNKVGLSPNDFRKSIQERYDL